MDPSVAQALLMYFLLPLWLAAGVADWFCHRRAGIEHNAGLKESLLHVLMLAEVGLPVLAGLFLKINALVLLFMVVMYFVHEATALWDVRYAVTRRRVSPWEQHVHSHLEMIPLMALVLVIGMHWDEARMLLDWPPSPESWTLALKPAPLPAAYVMALLGGVVLFAMLPYLNELWRDVQVRKRARQG